MIGVQYGINFGMWVEQGFDVETDGITLVIDEVIELGI